MARESTPSDLVQPGHVFPLQAQDGGVLMRAGHTEAGCDLARMAGLAPSSVICEIMNDDGSMARLPELEVFAKEHGIKIGTIADLIAYRSRNESLIERGPSRRLSTPWGEFDAVSFSDRTGQAHLALSVGAWTGDDEVLVRVHEPLSIVDLLDGGRPSHSWALPKALQALQSARQGVAVLLNCGQTPDAVLTDFASATASPPPRTALDLRTYGVGVQILRDLGVRRMKLLSNRRRMPSMVGYGIEVTGFLASDSTA